MFGDYVLEKTSARYDSRILLIDEGGLEQATHYSADFRAHGFDVVYYKDDLTFRIEFEEKVKATNDRIMVMAESTSFIPYDIYRRFRAYTISLSSMFPKLNSDVLREHSDIDLDLLCVAYKNNFESLTTRRQTEDFIRYKVYGVNNLCLYLEQLRGDLLQAGTIAKTYQDWIAVAETKAKVDVLAAAYKIDMDTSEINRMFQGWVLQQFGKLSSEIDLNTPVLVSRAMEYMCDHSEKFVVIVMDGMSEFDWKILASSFTHIPYEQTAVFAMIPTTTSISRQCLLSDKYPSQLTEPWKQSKEKAEFVSCAKAHGFADNQIGYGRGYDVDFGSFVRCGAIIINDVDDTVHAQRQGRQGMYLDISSLSEQGELARLTERYLARGFDVYITADHGNTPCVGLGKLMGTGVEMETKSRRMLVLQDFADEKSLIEKYGLIEYPKYYLKKDFVYLICNIGDSFDVKGEGVMTHGGISIDEVIVPFIKVKAGQIHG